MRLPRAWIALAWIAYCAAWALPVHADGVRLPASLPGWQAFRLAASPLWPYEGTSFSSFDTWYGAVLSALSASTNIVMLASVWVIARSKPSLLLLLSWACLASFLVNAHWWLFDMEKSLEDLRSGYWVWWCSFLAVGAGAIWLRHQVRELE